MSIKNNDPLDTPVMRQYLEIKAQYPQAILLFRMGDFYELFLDDATKAAPIMDIALTRRQNNIAMAGVPYHSVENYIGRLLEAGLHVAIAEQEVDPRNPRLMYRRVQRVITPGTLVEERLLNQSGHNYLMSLVRSNNVCSMSFADVSTGDFFVFEIDIGLETKNEAPFQANNANPSLIQVFRDYYAKFNPREVLLPSDLYSEFNHLPEYENFVLMEAWKASPTEGRQQIQMAYGQSLEGLGFIKNTNSNRSKNLSKNLSWSVALGAVFLILHYIQQNFPNDTLCLQAPVLRNINQDYMQLDEQSIRNLDLISHQKEGTSKRTLFNVLDFCQTASGKRFLRESLLLPLINKIAIQERQEIVALLVHDEELRNSLTSKLQQVSDIERITARLSTGRGVPRDFIALKKTLSVAQILQQLCQETQAECMQDIIEVPTGLDLLEKRIVREVHPEPPVTLPGNTPFVQLGLDKQLDTAREAFEKGSNWIRDFEKKERERTGLSSLKVKYNRVHGYFIEIGRVQAKDAPKEYYRRQTLVAYERFSSQTLSELESTLGEAEQTIQRIEQEYFLELVKNILQHTLAIKELMQQIASLDFLNSLALTAHKYNWTCPQICDENRMEIRQGRHPVVEQYLENNDEFTANDLYLDSSNNTIAILTGPNMAGKSTYIRQAALIQLLAQIGSFVPATSAHLSIRDCIFTRIGASDNLSRGESTFYTEMLETARILNQSSSRSLVIMDEVGRGTSTYDGLSLAWAIIEFLSSATGPRPLTLFATHYHELTQLSDSIAIVFNLTMDVKEAGDKIVFLHSVRKGVANRSYGIHVARLAGLPLSILKSAEKKLYELEMQSHATLGPLPQGDSSLPPKEFNIEKEIEENVLMANNPAQTLLLNKQNTTSKENEAKQNIQLGFFKT